MLTDSLGHEMNDLYIFCPITVAGVTFKNGRRHRQSILRAIYWKDSPYHRINKSSCLDFVKTEFDGKPAVEVWVSGVGVREMIGYIPKAEAAFFAEHLDSFHSIFDFEVYGGGDHSYGCSFVARFINNSTPSHSAQIAEEPPSTIPDKQKEIPPVQSTPFSLPSHGVCAKCFRYGEVDYTEDDTPYCSECFPCTEDVNGKRSSKKSKFLKFALFVLFCIAEFFLVYYIALYVIDHIL